MTQLAFLINGWAALLIAIIFGVLGTTSLKLSHGLHKGKSALFILLFYTISFVALTFAMRTLDLSVVYAVWAGLGTAIISIIGIFYFKERLSWQKILFLLFIIIGVIGIH